MPGSGTPVGKNTTIERLCGLSKMSKQTFEKDENSVVTIHLDAEGRSANTINAASRDVMTEALTGRRWERP